MIYRNPLYAIAIAGTICFILGSCSPHVNKMTVKKESIVYPAPPDTARFQFLTSFSSSANLDGKQTAVAKYIFGESELKPIKKPYGIAIHNGKIYICDTGLGGLEVIDLEKQSFGFIYPSGKAQLKLPLNCFIDDESNLYVADGERRQVVILDHTGNYIDVIGDTGTFKPTDVFVSENKIWVTDIKNNKVNVYDRDTREFKYSIPGYKQGEEGFLYNPANIYVTFDKIYVSDIGDFRVKVYTHEGKFIRSVGSSGSNIGQFSRPKGIAVDLESNLFVVDAGFENVQVFDKKGNVLMYFGGPYKGPGDMWLPAKIMIDYDNMRYFQKYVDPGLKLKYLVFVTNQYGPDKINVYGAVRPK
jgi:DNA-binding beta-propeller fold protein YncE